MVRTWGIRLKRLLKFSSYWLRVAGTGLSFVAFGLGGLFLFCLIFPLYRIIPLGAERRKKLIQYNLHVAFKLFIGLMRCVGAMRVKIIGREKLRSAQGQLIIANHPSLIDVVAIISIVPTADCIVKAGAYHHFFWGGVVRAAGFIKNDDPHSLIEECAKRIQAGNNLILFPEGTRTTPGKPRHFQRGAARIALLSSRKVQPVFIDMRPSTLTKDKKWYQIPEVPAVLTVVVKDAFQVDSFLQYSDNGPRRLTEFLETYFIKAQEEYESKAG